MNATTDPYDAEFQELNEIDDPVEDPVGMMPAAPMIRADQAVDIVAISEEIERRVDAAIKIRKAVFKFSYPNDWRRHDKDGGATAYLESKGAQRIANLLGIGWDVDPGGVEKHNHVDSDGRGYYSYTISGHATWRGRTIPVTGGCTSRHPLLSKGGKIPSEDVNEVHVRKKAKTDFIRMAVCEIAGLKDIPIEEMPEGWAGSIPKQEYRNGTQGGDTSTDSDKQGQDEVLRLINDICQGDESKGRAFLEEITSFKGRDGEMVPGLRTTKFLKGKRLEICLEKVRKEHAFRTGGGR